MAITKIGIDYYPRSVTMMKDRKFNKARQKYGYLVYVIYDALLEMIYSDKGYYLKYDDSTKEEVNWELQDYCKGKYTVESQTISEVIEMLVECGLFSGDHFKQGIITSRRIQEIYYKVTVERRKVAVDSQIWILNLEEMKRISSKSSILQQAQFQPNIGGTSEEHQRNKEDNQSNMDNNQPNKEQSKVNERKVNESKVNESKVNETTTKEQSCSSQYTDIDIPKNIEIAYISCFKRTIEKDRQVIIRWLETFDIKLICEAFKITKEQGKDHIGYTNGILMNWYAKGITDFTEYLFSND